jgi:hypothetical protein
VDYILDYFIGLKMNIGDRIIGKKTGTLTPSTIVAVMTWEFYCKVFFTSPKAMESTIEAWSKHYPDFQSKLIVISKFDEPQKNISFDEFKTSIDSESDEFTDFVREIPIMYNLLLKIRYDKLPNTITVSYPEEDCEVLDESYSTQY